MIVREGEDKVDTISVNSCIPLTVYFINSSAYDRYIILPSCKFVHYSRNRMNERILMTDILDSV